MKWWFNRKESPNEALSRKLKAEIAGKIKVRAQFENMTVDFEFPKEFQRLTNEFCTGHIEWREFRVEDERDIMSADNKWKANSSIKTHRHDNAEETIQSVYGSGLCITYDDYGNEIERIIIPQGGSYTIPARVNHFVSCEEDWDLIVKFDKV